MMLYAHAPRWQSPFLQHENALETGRASRNSPATATVASSDPAKICVCSVQDLVLAIAERMMSWLGAETCDGSVSSCHANLSCQQVGKYSEPAESLQVPQPQRQGDPETEKVH